MRRSRSTTAPRPEVTRPSSASRACLKTEDHARELDPKVNPAARFTDADPSAELKRRLVLDGFDKALEQRSRCRRVARLDGAQVLGRQLLRSGREQGTLRRNLADFHRKGASF